MAVRFAGAFESTPGTRPPDVNFTCSHPLVLPNMLMIVWDRNSPLARNADFRHAMSQLMPRHALVSAGAAALAEVATSPVPHNHPGFDAKSPVHAFDLRSASLALNKLGYRRQTAGSPRLDKQGDPLHLLLLTQNQVPGLAEKVIVDAISAVGINIQIKSALSPGEKADGMLANLAVDWPRVNFLPYLHSDAESAWPVATVSGNELDRALEKYAESLTNAKPDWALLGNVQRHIEEIEPVTVLLQQKACLETPTSLKLAKGIISQRDPDWFRQMLF